MEVLYLSQKPEPNPELEGLLDQLGDLRKFYQPLPRPQTILQPKYCAVIFYLPKTYLYPMLMEWVIYKRRHCPELKMVALFDYLDGQGKLTYLEIGLDCCLDIHTNPQELLATLRAEFRVAFEREHGYLRYQDLVLDPLLEQVWAHNQPISLRPKEYLILKHLLSHPGRIVSQRELINTLWPHNLGPLSNSLEAHISSLRHKLKSVSQEPIINTMVGRGYFVNRSKPISVTLENGRLLRPKSV